MPRPIDPHVVARLARFLLAAYLLVAGWMLFSPQGPGSSVGGRLELAGHFGLLFGLGVLVAYSVPSLSPVWRLRLVLLSGLVVGLGTELVQGILPTRAFEGRDLAADFVGTIVAALVVPLGPSPGADQSGA